MTVRGKKTIQHTLIIIQGQKNIAATSNSVDSVVSTGVNFVACCRNAVSAYCGHRRVGLNIGQRPMAGAYSGRIACADAALSKRLSCILIPTITCCASKRNFLSHHSTQIRPALGLRGRDWTGRRKDSVAHMHIPLIFLCSCLYYCTWSKRRHIQDTQTQTTRQYQHSAQRTFNGCSPV